MSQFYELLSKRRSIRKFTDELLRDDEVELILKAGLMAPSSKNRRSWEYIAVEEKEMLGKLSKCKAHGAAMIANAALALVVVGDETVSDVWIEDASVATILMQLQAEDLDIGSCWIQCRLRETEYGINSEEFIKDLMEIPPHLQVLSVIAFGRKAETKLPIDESTLMWEKIHIGKW